MSSRKKLSRYPPVFTDIVDSAIAKPQVLTFRTPEAAAAMRRELYNFRFALRKAAITNPDLWVMLSLSRANRLSFRLKGERLTIGQAYAMNEINNHEQFELTLRNRTLISPSPRQHPNK